MIKDRTKIMIDWYNKPEVKFNIINFTKNREMSFLIPSYEDKELKKASVRMLKCHSVQHLDFIFKCLNVYEFKRPYNLYYTIAKYKNGIPNQHLGNMHLRNNSEWNKTHFNHIESYDYFIDIDAPNIEDMDYTLESAKELKKLFDSLDVPYMIVFSGMGFHFKIPYKYLPKSLNFNPKLENNIYGFLSECTEKLYSIISEMIDTGIYDSRRLCKIPYTLSNYENDIFVCSPINSNEEFNNFNINNYKIENFKLNRYEEFIFNSDGNFNNLLTYLKGKGVKENETKYSN